MTTEIKPGRVYLTTAGSVMLTAQSIPREPYNVVEWTVRNMSRPRPRNIEFYSRNKVEAVEWIQARTVCIIAEPHEGECVTE